MSLFICPEHGVHHGPFCHCDKPQEWWDGSFETENTDMTNEIYPAPGEFSDAQISSDPILHFFHYAHLPPKLQATSRTFFVLAAHCVNTLPRNAERSVALRKLLEAKDAAVRANLAPPPPSWSAKSGVAFTKEVGIGEPVEIGGHDEDRDGPIPFGD